MLKLISKSFFVSILCGSLMLMDFSYKGSILNAAMAESVKTDKIDDADLMGTLTMTVVGTLATRLYSYKMTTDMMLAAAGGAIFIGGEVLAYLKLKEVMEGMEVAIARDKKGNVNKEQIEALERLKKSYEEARETAETKKTLQMAAAAAFAAAGVAAFTMAGVETAQLTACTASIAPVISAAAASAAACTVGGCSAPFINCVNAATKLSASITGYELKKQATGPSATCLAAYTSANTALAAEVNVTGGVCAASGGATIATACNSKLSIDAFDSSGGVGLVTPATPSNNPLIKKLINEQKSAALIAKASPVFYKNSFSNLLSKTLDLLVPKADAALFSAMGIASSAAISFLLYTQASLGPQIDMFMLIPQNRAIVWGILAGLTFAATSATENVIDQIDQNISKIDRILQSMYQMANGATGTQTALKKPNTLSTPKPQTKMQFNATNYGEIDIKKATGDSLPCYTGSDSKDCKSFTDSVQGTQSFKGLNIESQKQLNGILSTANGFNGTSKISSASLNGAASLAGSANALKIALANAKAKNDEALKKAKSKFNIDEQAKKMSGIIDRKIREGLKKTNSNPAGMYSAMYGGKSAVGSAAAGSEADKSKTAELGNTTPTANVVDMSAPTGGEADLGITGASSGTDDKALTAEELAKINEQQAAVAGKDTIDQYDLKNDITSDKSSSIFDLISNRYQKSGYPRLFKIKEPQAPAPVTK